MTRAFRAAAVQMVSGGDVDRNLEQAASLVRIIRALEPSEKRQQVTVLPVQ